MIIAAITERLDIFMLSAFKGPVESGLYGAILPLILVPEVAIGFAVSVLQPRVADLYEKGQLFEFWMAICRLTVPLAVASALFVWLFADSIINLTIGPTYLEAAPVLRILFLAVMLWFSVVPVAVAFVVMTLPRATLAITVLQAVLIVTAGFLMIPGMGATGAATALLMMRVFSGTMICIAAVWLLRTRKQKKAEGLP